MTKEFLSKNFFINFVLYLFSVLSNHTANNYGRLELDSPGYQTAASLQPLTENSRHEKIEVQILPHVSFSFYFFARNGVIFLSATRKKHAKFLESYKCNFLTKMLSPNNKNKLMRRKRKVIGCKTLMMHLLYKLHFRFLNVNSVFEPCLIRFPSRIESQRVL